MIGGMASIFGTTVIFQISKSVSLYAVFTGMGIYIIAVALLMIIGVRDIILMKKKLLLLDSVTSTPRTITAKAKLNKSCM
jgi:hypothetical protein